MLHRICCVTIVVLASLHSNAQSFEIIDSLLPRCVGNTEMYRERIDSFNVDFTDSIQYMMIHFCSAMNSNPENPHNIANILQDFRQLGVSPHYIIDRNGKIFRLIPDKYLAFHAGKGYYHKAPYMFRDYMNYYSIGIELMGIGTWDEMKLLTKKEIYARVKQKDKGFTAEQYTSLNFLIDYIISNNPSIKKDKKHIVGHNEYSNKRLDPGLYFNWGKIKF